MFHKILSSVDQHHPFTTASAHCDVPCGIYDPGVALYAAVSVVRLTDQLLEAYDKEPSLQREVTMGRLITQKEEQAEIVKHEIRVIWGDYIKAAHIEAHPEVHQLAHNVMAAASACKQEASRAHGEQLVEAVNVFAELFWATKGVDTVRRPADYPPNLDVVRPL